MQQVLIDACGWVAVVDSGMNFDSEALNILGRPQLLLLPKVIEELRQLDALRPRGKKLLLELLTAKSEEVDPRPGAGEHTDDQLVDLAQSSGMTVLTVDVQLKRRLFERAVPVLEVTKKKRLRLIEGL
jgi:rRNA-processing protein FCF1